MVFACRTEKDRELSEQPMYGRDSSCVHPGYKPRALLPHNPAQKNVLFFAKSDTSSVYSNICYTKCNDTHTHTHTHIHTPNSATQLGRIELHCRVMYVCILCDTYLIN
jgi:hypothetical protein